MSALQIQVAESLEGLSDENLSFLLEMINRFMKPAVDENPLIQNLSLIHI